MLSYQVAILSESGGRKYNEDACGHLRSDSLLCCVMADGAGGHGGGEIASRLAVTTLLTGFSHMPTVNGDELLALVHRANQAILDARVPGAVTQNMHTTIVCLIVDTVHENAVWAHSGDSRLYWFRNDRMIERTRDHSYVQSLVDAGLIQESETRSHPKRSQLNSALGREAQDLEVSASMPSRGIEFGDVFLLCSDGVWDHLNDEALECSLKDARSPEDWLISIKQLIYEATRHLSSYDNFSALTVWLGAAPTSLAT